MSPFVCQKKFHQIFLKYLKTWFHLLSQSFCSTVWNCLLKQVWEWRLQNPSERFLLRSSQQQMAIWESLLFLVLTLSSGSWEFMVRLSLSLPLLPLLMPISMPTWLWYKLVSMRIRSSLLVLKCSSLPWVVLVRPWLFHSSSCGSVSPSVTVQLDGHLLSQLSLVSMSLFSLVLQSYWIRFSLFHLSLHLSQTYGFLNSLLILWTWTLSQPTFLGWHLDLWELCWVRTSSFCPLFLQPFLS